MTYTPEKLADLHSKQARLKAVLLAEIAILREELERLWPERDNGRHKLHGSRRVASLRNPSAIPYRELGSIDGFITKVELDGYNRPIVWLKQRIDRQLVKCITKGKALDAIGHYEVAEVLKAMRVQMFGLIHYKDLEKIDHIDVDNIRVYEDDKHLPNYEDIVDPSMTNGIEASEYLKRLRKYE